MDDIGMGCRLPSHHSNYRLDRKPIVPRTQYNPISKRVCRSENPTQSQWANVRHVQITERESTSIKNKTTECGCRLTLYTIYRFAVVSTYYYTERAGYNNIILLCDIILQ